MLHESFSYEPFLQYGINLFFKNNYIKFEIIVKGVSGKSGFFLIELPIVLPIGSVSFRLGRHSRVFPLRKTYFGAVSFT